MSRFTDTDNNQDAKALSSAIKDRRKDRAAKYAVPLPKVRGIAEEGKLPNSISMTS